VSSREVYF